MARVSFSLRRDTTSRGSYVRYDTDTYDAAASAGNAAIAGSWTYDADRDVDQYLRSDNFQIPVSEFVEFDFEAYAVAYDKVQLDWEAPLEPIDVTTVATETVVVYSPQGPPATLGSGQVLAEGSTTFTHVHTGLLSGQWAYYTLFIRYQSTSGDDYYENVASLSVLVPYPYGSNLLLWKRIPEYYRIEDEKQSVLLDPIISIADAELFTELGVVPENNRVGPLFKFLSVFGFEIDRMRTLIDHTMISRDPSIASLEDLLALSNLLGTNFNLDFLNAARLRSVLDDIGYLRRTQGTIEGFRSLVRALSGSEVDIDTSANTIRVYSHRVNYITDPRFLSGIFDTRPAHVAESIRRASNQGSYDLSSGAGPTTGSFGEPLAEGMFWTVSVGGTFKGFTAAVGDYLVAHDDGGGTIVTGLAPASFSSTAFDADFAPGTTNEAYTESSNIISDAGNALADSAGVTHVLARIGCTIPVLEGDSLYFSVHSGIGSNGLVWARLVDASGNVMGKSISHTRAGSFPAVEIPIIFNADPDNFTNGYIEYLIDIDAAGGTYNASEALAERNHLGPYFDGSSQRGGWTITANGSAVSDFRWYNNTANNAPSMYTEDYERLNAALLELLPAALPVSETYTILSTSAVPGYP